MRECVIGLAVFSMLLFRGASTLTAAVTGYTDLAAFQADLPGVETIVNFDLGPNGQVIASGNSYGGITFTYDFGGVNLIITDAGGAPSTSDPLFLGTDDGDILQDGDDVSFSFSSRNAFGISIISLDSLLDGDLKLVLGSFEVALVEADQQATLSDGSGVWFLGLISDAPISSVDLTTLGIGAFLYNLDDVRSAVAVPVGAVPEPASLTIWGLTALGCSIVAYRRRKRA